MGKKKYRGNKKNMKKKSRKSAWPLPICVKFPGIGFPDELEIGLKYVTQVSLTGSSAPSAYVFRMNSLFDPDLTGSGTQPQLFDQLSAIYGVYCVIKAEAVIQWTNPGTTEGAYVVGVLSDQNISTQTVENLKESKYERDSQVSYAPGPNRHRMVIPEMETAQIMGQEFIRSDPNMYAGIGSNPNDQWFLIIKCAATDGSTSISVNASVKIIFTAIFKDLTSVGES